MKLTKSIFFLLFLLCFGLHQVSGQENVYWLKIFSEENLKQHRISEVQQFNSELKRQEYLQQLILDFRARMFIEASVDSIWGKDTLSVHIHIGQKYELETALPTVYEKSRKSSLRLGPPNLSTTLLNIDDQLNYWQENGHPFAEIFWDTLTLDTFKIRMIAKIEKGPLIIIDSLKNLENGKISTSFLRSYLGIKKNMPYRESLLKESDQLLQKLPFVKFTKPSTVQFQGDKARLNVYLAQRKVSKFDFLVGLLPNNEGTGKMLITGEAKLQLQNAFKRGEEIFFEWKRVQANSQLLRLKFNYPYILQSPIGTSATFLLDKRDSTFLDVNWTLGVPFRTKANNYIKAYIENTQTIVLQVDTVAVKNRMRLPSVQDVSALLYGFEGYFENLDYLFNPRRGIEVGANVQVGTRKIKPNSAITRMGEEFEVLYDSIQLKTFQTQLKAHFAAYIKMSQRQVAKFSMRGASKISKGVLDNELYRIGGSNLLRGFDEESIFVQHYLIATAEYRFILDQNSYFYGFFDAGFVGKQLEEKFSKDFPIGFGAGIAFETKAGIFGLSYAVGRQQKNPIDFRTSKLHFGYVNIF